MVLTIILVSVTHSGADAQTNHVLQGVVKDPTGAVVPGSRVEARGTGAPRRDD